MVYKTPEHIAEYIRENSDNDNMYIYDLEVMRTKMDLLNCLPENVETFYAMKVNPHVDVVSEALIHENISGIEVASQGEIDQVINAGEEDASRIIYTGPSKKPRELEFSVENDIRYLNVESLVEAVRIDLEAKRKGVVQPILLRLNTKHSFKEGEAGVVLGSGATQFGVPQASVVKDLEMLHSLENIKVEGFHMYPATGVMKAKVLLESVDASFKFLNELEKLTGEEYKTIDFGGGFGIDYGGVEEFNIEEYSQGLAVLIEKYNMSDKTLILELGRFIGADMGYFVTKINDIKKIGKNDQGDMVTGIMCNAGTNAHKRPQVLSVDYHVDIVAAMNESNTELAEALEEIGVTNYDFGPEDVLNVYGPFCTSVDYIAKGKRGLSGKIGDYVVMPQAGAYGLTMSPQDFLSHPKVPEHVINKS